MTTYEPNDDYGAQHIALATPDSGTVITWPVTGWGNPGEGWPHLTPVITTTDGPQALTFHPDQQYSYGHTAYDATWNLRQRLARQVTR
ncbi:hypothetical protein [Micromonospora sp. NPDC023956]|uniref:hypothetical protein n=1 Tax=Micromonospora sp. NPDC023956 TaxID=3155722 RepID=UPI0033E504E5